jgi:hypothetical protein
MRPLRSFCGLRTALYHCAIDQADLRIRAIDQADLRIVDAFNEKQMRICRTMFCFMAIEKHK